MKQPNSSYFIFFYSDSPNLDKCKHLNTGVIKDNIVNYSVGDT